MLNKTGKEIFIGSYVERANQNQNKDGNLFPESRYDEKIVTTTLSGASLSLRVSVSSTVVPKEDYLGSCSLGLSSAF
jgi:hypothetical protein